MSPSSTSDFRRFLGRVALFLLPLAAAAAPFEIILWRSGECWPASEAAAATGPGTIYMRKYFSQQFTLYKSEMLRRRKPEIVILGSSRVFQFRDFMFEPKSAYNAGGMVQNVKDLETYADWLRDGRLPTPKAIILGIDPWWIRQGEELTPVNRNREWDEAYRPVAHFDGIRAMILKGEIPWSLIVREPHGLGLGAIQNGIGFRDDGSLYAGLSTLVETRFRDRIGVVDNIRSLGSMFLATPGVDWAIVTRLTATLDRLKAAGIEISVVLPTFSEACVEALKASPHLSNWWREYSEELPKRLECFAALTPSSVGMTDDYMIDGYHPGEVLVSRIVEELILRSPPGSVLHYLDPVRLRWMREQPGVMPLAFPR